MQRTFVAVAVDRLGNLYVVEFGSNDVKVFQPGSLTASKTLVAPGLGRLEAVALDRRGTV